MTYEKDKDPDLRAFEESLRSDLHAVERPIDDLTAARVWSGLSTRLLRQSRQSPASRHRALPRLAVAGIAFVCLPVAAAVAYVGLGVRVHVEWNPPAFWKSLGRRSTTQQAAPVVPVAAPAAAPILAPAPLPIPHRLASASPTPKTTHSSPPAVAGPLAAVEPAAQPPGERVAASDAATAAVFYARAEDALRRGATVEARVILERLVQRFGATGHGQVALYELTLMAMRARDFSTARRHAGALAAGATDDALRARAQALLRELDTVR